MLLRQPRVGDIVDDYCPRERRLSDHAVVAMVGDEIRQTRCTTCDTEHEYKQAKVPPSRKKATPVLPPKPPAGAATALPRPPEPLDDSGTAESGDAGEADSAAAAPQVQVAGLPAAPEGSVHRRLIRAVLPRIEGEVPVRQAPEFTMHRVAATGHGRPPRAAHGGQPRQGGKAAAHARQPGRHGAGGFGQKGSQAGRGGHDSHGGPGGHRAHGKGRHGRPPGGGHGRGGKH